MMLVSLVSRLSKLVGRTFWWSLRLHIVVDWLSLVSPCHVNYPGVDSDVERAFSTFGLVHSKLRNRLGVAKAAKLVCLYTDF